MFKLNDKEKNTIVGSKLLLNWSYEPPFKSSVDPYQLASYKICVIMRCVILGLHLTMVMIVLNITCFYIVGLT